MKALNFFTILFIAVMFITSCEEEEVGTQQQVTKTYTYSENLRGSEAVKGELTLPELELVDIIGIEAANNIDPEEPPKMQLGDSNLEISGLNQIESPDDTTAVVLENFTIKVGTRQGVNLGDCSTDAQGTNEFDADVEQSTNEFIGVIQNIFADVTSGNQSATIAVSFTPNVNITSSDNVQLKITITGTYHYLVFE